MTKDATYLLGARGDSKEGNLASVGGGRRKNSTSKFTLCKSYKPSAMEKILINLGIKLELPQLAGRLLPNFKAKN